MTTYGRTRATIYAHLPRGHKGKAKIQEGMMVLSAIDKGVIPMHQRENTREFSYIKRCSTGVPPRFIAVVLPRTESVCLSLPNMVSNATRFSCILGAPIPHVIPPPLFSSPFVNLYVCLLSVEPMFLANQSRAEVSRTGFSCYRKDGIRRCPRGIFSMVCRIHLPAAVSR